MKKLDQLVIKGQCFMSNKLSGVKETLTQKKKGAFTFEYIIVTVLMVFVIYSLFNILRPALINEAEKIVNFITNNGTVAPTTPTGP